MVFDDAGAVVGIRQLEHRQIYPQAGWVEHDPLEIWRRAGGNPGRSRQGRFDSERPGSEIGITNQRETAVVWNLRTGQPYYNAIVWQDTRATGSAASWLERLS